MTKLKALLLASAATAVALTAGPAYPQSASDIANLTELVVVADQTIELPQGGLKYKNVTIKQNGKIVITGSTTILTGKLITEAGAKIEYKPDPNATAKPVLTVDAVDASQLTELDIVGDGAAGQGYEPGKSAAPGANGDGAVTECHGILPPKCTNHGASPGQPGHGGAIGGSGKPGLDVTLYLPGLKPGAQIRAEAIGGDGGRGQDGGNGGVGGSPNKVHPGGHGGDGGAAGSGGTGGDSGTFHAFIVLAESDMSKAAEFIDSVKIDANVAAGKGGAPGVPGAGGPGGGESGYCVGHGCSADSGQAGHVGNPGDSGNGPTAGQLTQKWVSVEAMDLPTYQAYIAQVWNNLGGK